MPQQPIRITSSQNPQLRHLVRLRSARVRVRENQFLIDGHREIQRAREAGIEILACYFSVAETDESLRDGARACARPATAVYHVAPELLAKVTYGDRADTAVAVARTPDVSLNAFVPPAHGLFAVLEGVEKPGNVGAILRTANAAGVDGVILADRATDLFNPNAIRASTGAIFDTPVYVSTAQQARAWLDQHQVGILAARVDASDFHHAVRYDGSLAIVLGSEAHGLSSVWSDVPAIRIPMSGIVDSLNVSVTAAVLFYEARRQRSQADAEPRS